MSVLFTLFITFFKIGAFTFGGGYAMLPLVQQEVIAHNWMNQEELVNFIAVSEATPGPFAVNISTYVGSVVGGLSGAICATLGVILPAFIIILIIAKVFSKFQQSKVVKGMMLGLHPTVVGLIGASIISVGSEVFFQNGLVISSSLLFSIIVCLLAICLSFSKHMHPIWIILISALLGIVAGNCGIL